MGFHPQVFLYFAIFSALTLYVILHIMWKISHTHISGKLAKLSLVSYRFREVLWDTLIWQQAFYISYLIFIISTFILKYLEVLFLHHQYFICQSASTAGGLFYLPYFLWWCCYFSFGLFKDTLNVNYVPLVSLFLLMWKQINSNLIFSA